MHLILAFAIMCVFFLLKKKIATASIFAIFVLYQFPLKCTKF